MMAASDQRYLVFKYPKKSWTVFSRQNDAIECASKKSDQKVFALEISREARTFLVCDVDNFWNYYNKLTQKHFYEVIVTGAPVKLFLDLEFYEEFNEECDGQRMTKELISVFVSFLKTTYNIQDSGDGVIILDSSNIDKFSHHVIFTSVYFSNSGPSNRDDIKFIHFI